MSSFVSCTAVSLLCGGGGQTRGEEKSTYQGDNKVPTSPNGFPDGLREQHDSRTAGTRTTVDVGTPCADGSGWVWVKERVRRRLVVSGTVLRELFVQVLAAAVSGFGAAGAEFTPKAGGIGFAARRHGGGGDDGDDGDGSEMEVGLRDVVDKETANKR